MRHVKMFGLAAVAAVAAMAFVGAGSAVGNGSTVLCTTSELPCLANPANSIHLTSVGEPLESTTSPVLHILCLSSLLSGTSEGLNNPLGITITSLTFTGCYTLPKGASHNCEVKVLDLGGGDLGLLDILKIAKNLATATLLRTQILLKCGAIIHCILGGASTTGLTVESALHTAGAGHGNLKASGIAVPKAGGTLCPASATWSVTWESLTHLWLSS